MLTDFSTHFSN